jgi:hypothetical protein
MFEEFAMSFISSMLSNKAFARGPRRHKAPSALAQAIWRMTQQQQFPVPEVALLLALPPQRVARVVDAMHQRRIDRWRML